MANILFCPEEIFLKIAFLWAFFLPKNYHQTKIQHFVGSRGGKKSF